MIKPDLNDPVAPQTMQSSLFDGAAFPGNAYNEAFSSPGVLREHWQALMAALDKMGPDVLNQSQDRVKRMRHEDGATYNPFDDPSERGGAWALEMIPLPLSQREWGGLEAGLIQRAHLLEQILADTYGPQNLMKEGLIPAELVFANPNFPRTCHGIRPNGNRFLTYYAADLYRGVDGRFRVLRDYGGNPSGLGYALENRIVMSRVLSNLYHQTQIHRLAPFFQIFHRNLIQRASLQRDDPGIVLLSPGPDSPIYFEQALLSRYLGYPLVEGQDLTVRNGKMFLKKLAGLEPVEAIFRHIADNDSDPFELRRTTGIGVAGLIQVSREENIDIINPVGSGFVDTPALSVFLPSLSRRLMGEDLLLENHPAWWCGNADGLNYVTANLGQMTVVPSMDRWTAPPDPAALMAAIQAAPHAFMAREPICPASVPVWDGKGVTARHTLLRIFACATDQGFAVMPGGLAITAPDVETLTGDDPERRQSKDIWVLSDQPVEPFSLLEGSLVVTEFRRSSDLPSRVADHLLWLGRYLERAEGLVRLLRSIFHRLSGEARPEDIPDLPFLMTLLMAENIMPKTPFESNAIAFYRELPVHLNTVLYQKDQPGSVVSILDRTYEAARHVRDRLSPDSWRVINRLEDFTGNRAVDPLELLDDTLFTLSAFSGLAMENMTRGLGWRFMDMGRRLERAMRQAGLIRISLPQLYAESRSALEALLEVSDSIMTYRARYRSAFQPAQVLDLLLMDESNPKSLAFQFNRLADHVEHLPRQSERPFASPEERMALEMLTAVRLLDFPGPQPSSNGAENEPLAIFLESMETRLKDFSQQISAHYLSRVPETPHFSMISGDDRP